MAEAHQAISDGARRTWAVPEISKRRSEGISAAKQGRNHTHCKKGHEFTPDNTVISIHGARRCRTCRNAGRRANAAKRYATDPDYRDNRRKINREWVAKKRAADPEAARKKQRKWIADPKHLENSHQSAKRSRERNRLKLREKARIRAANLRRLARIGRSVSTGRKRNDKIRARVIELRAEGKSWAQLTGQINRETGQTLTTRAFRHYLEDS